MTTIYLADAPTYASHLAAYPELGAAIFDLPAGTRRYIEDMGCEVHRSPEGLFWIAERAVNGPVCESPTDALCLYGPSGCSTLSTTTNQSRQLVRPTFYQMPGNTAQILRGFYIYNNGNAIKGASSGGFDVRLYAAYPNGAPIRGAAPLYVWSYNPTGTGTGGVGIGTGTPGAIDITTTNGTWVSLALPGGNRRVPAHFWLAIRADYDTAAGLTCIAQNSIISGKMPYLTPVNGTAAVSRSQGYSWDEGATFTLGAAAVFDAAAEMITTASNSYCALVDLLV